MKRETRTVKGGLLLRARVVLPVSTAAIQDGAVLIARNRITAVGKWRHLSTIARNQRLDLGDVVLMPGLINAHCHLDYTHMAGQFPPPKVFSDWLKTITATKAAWSFSEYAASWLEGARMLVRTGTTTVADIEAVPELLPEVWNATPLRVFSFLEMTGITSRRQPRVILQNTVRRIASLKHSRDRAWLSPHAPYSTVPELVRSSARTARRRRWGLCTHVAESEQEFEMFVHGRGEMFDWLRRSQRDMSDCGLGTPVEHLRSCGALGRNLLAVHVNYLGSRDAALLSDAKANVVHCPRSHAYFGHAPFPLLRLTRAGVNLCLGTDSLASVLKSPPQAVELNLFEEMRALARGHAALSPRTILRMATVNGARALGLGGRVGQISEGAWADLIAIPFTGKVSDIYNAVVQHRGDVAASMIDGRWTIGPNSEA
ncbi:MAG: hypothetical protein DME25_00145 [Verrucomicrobia bacterium]|nr:MAG: hypothetical protein DME25_00145 [Verrucomicrobiota bacterium]